MKTDKLKITVIDHEEGFIGPSCQRGFQELGHNVQLLKLKGEEGTKILDFFDLTSLLSEIISFKPDLILDINGKACDKDGISLSAYRILNIPVFIWFVDNPLIALNYGSYKYSHLFTKLVYDKFQCEEMKRMGISDTYHLPLGSDVYCFRPLLLEPSEEEKYKSNISFVGHSYADRCVILRNVLRNKWQYMPPEMNDVIRHSVDLFLNGTNKKTPEIYKEALEHFGLKPDYPQGDIEWVLNIIIEHESGRDYRASLIKPLLRYGIKIYGNKSWSIVLGDYNISSQVHYFNELPKVYNASDINLNISRTQLVTAVNQRVFDVPACRSFLLTDYKEELEDYFVIGKEVICYKDHEDLCRLVSYYLGNPLLRNKIAEAGYERVMAEHTYTVRMKRLLEIYKNISISVPEIEENGETWEKANIFIGQAYLNILNKDKAACHFKRALNRNSNSYIYNLNSIGMSLLQSKEYSDCIPFFKEAATLDPEDPSFLSNAGQACQKLGKYEDAEDYYKKAILVDPAYTIAISNLKGLHQKLKTDSINVKYEKPKLSLCMIVKNEEENLPRCLDVMRKVSDELIIVDTGSTDRTSDIAKRYDAKLYSFKWNDNFSDARNASLGLATGEWILILDADEVIADKDLEALKGLCNNTDFDAFSFITRNYINDSRGAIWVPNDNSYKEGALYTGWFTSIKVRLFKNDNRIRFNGVLHELVEPSIRRINLKIGKTEIPVHHYGTAKTGLPVKDKKRKYLDYCNKKIDEEPENPKAYYEYGILCAEAGLHEEAVRSFKNTLKLDPDFPLVDGLLGASLISLGYYEEAIIFLRRGITKEPENPGLYNNTASAYFELANFEEAINLFKKAIEINPAYASCYKNIGLAYLKTGMLKEAVRAFKKALSLNTSMEDVSMLIEKIGDIDSISEVAISDGYNSGIKSGLSLCMIVKDEESVLKSCLESVKGIVDEIIIVDTGSKDDTCKIASLYGAKIIQYAWSDDFSIPRNISIKNATCDYILWLDADECISPESRKTLLNLKHNISENRVEAYSVIITSTRDGEDEESFRRLRIFPNRDGVAFKGKVHEDVSESINDLGLKIKPADIIVIHKGYKNDEEVKSKVRRNIPLLLKQYEITPGEPLLSFYLANSYYCLGDTKQAIRFMERVIGSEKATLLKCEWFPFAFIKLAQFYRDNGRQKEIFEVYNKLFDLFPQLAIGHFFLGEILYFYGQYEDALKEFGKIQIDKIEVCEYPIPLRKIKYLNYYYSGCCFLELGIYKEAADFLFKAMELSPDSINLHISVARLFALTGNLVSCVEFCNIILNDLEITNDDTVDSIEELSSIFRTIGSVFENISCPHEAIEAFKTAVALNNINKNRHTMQAQPNYL